MEHQVSFEEEFDFWNFFFSKLNDLISNNLEKLPKRWKRFLAMYYPDSRVRRQCWIQTNVILGEGTYMNPYISVVDDYESDEILLEIGMNCSIAPGVIFAPICSHNNSNELRQQGLLGKYEKKEKIVVGNDVWIGANSVILAGVRIGDHCIIGANSFVNKSIPCYSLAYGSPIKVIKDLRE